MSSYHQTICLQAPTNGTTNFLSWNNYFGFNYGGFEVWRHTFTNNWELLTSIAWCGFPVCTNVYNDNFPIAGDTNRYAILVASPSPCVTTAKLNGTGVATTIVKARSNVKNNRTTAPVGIKETVKVNTFNLYPNPATDEVTVSVGGECNNCKIEIINTLGEIVKTSNVLTEKNKINVSDLVNGVYFIKITKVNKVASLQKLIIQR